MHDPQTVAFDIKSPFTRQTTSGYRYRDTLITIWHVDPERDGSDDSCGWFKRARHGNPETLAAITKAFSDDWDSQYSGWFEPEGRPQYSAMAITLGLFWTAAHHHFRFNRSKTRRFLSNHLLDIFQFAENPIDTLHDKIVSKYGTEKREHRIENFAAIIYGCILRWEQPWYRHPRWHVWHWRIQIHLVQHFKRWAFSRCCTCGKRFAWGYSPTSRTWNGGGPRWFRPERDVHHSECLGHQVAAAE